MYFYFYDECKNRISSFNRDTWKFEKEIVYETDYKLLCINYESDEMCFSNKNNTIVTSLLELVLPEQIVDAVFMNNDIVSYSYHFVYKNNEIVFHSKEIINDVVVNDKNTCYIVNDYVITSLTI